MNDKELIVVLTDAVRRAQELGAYSGDRLPIRAWQRDFAPVFKAALEAATPPVVDLEEVYVVLQLVRDLYNGGVWGGWADRWYAGCQTDQAEVEAAIMGAFNDTRIIGYLLAAAATEVTKAAHYASLPNPNWNNVAVSLNTARECLEGYGTRGCADCNLLGGLTVCCNNCPKVA